MSLSTALVFVFRVAPTKPPLTSSTVRSRHRCFIRRPDRLTPSHLLHRLSTAEPSPLPLVATTAPPPARAVADLAVYLGHLAPVRLRRVPLASSTPAPPHPSRLRKSIALPVANATSVVSTTPPSCARVAGRGPRGRTVVGRAWRDRGLHAGATRPRGSYASRPPPGIGPSDLFNCFSNF
jgi:hypothetical protein